MSKAPSAQEQRELRALFGVPEGEKLGLDDWGWLRILASGCGEQLEEKGYFYLTAKELKELSGREPGRVLCARWTCPRALTPSISKA